MFSRRSRKDTASETSADATPGEADVAGEAASPPGPDRGDHAAPTGGASVWNMIESPRTDAPPESSVPDPWGVPEATAPVPDPWGVPDASGAPDPWGVPEATAPVPDPWGVPEATAPVPDPWGVPDVSAADPWGVADAPPVPADETSVPEALAHEEPAPGVALTHEEPATDRGADVTDSSDPGPVAPVGASSPDEALAAAADVVRLRELEIEVARLRTELDAAQGADPTAGSTTLLTLVAAAVDQARADMQARLTEAEAALTAELERARAEAEREAAEIAERARAEAEREAAEIAERARAEAEREAAEIAERARAEAEQRRNEIVAAERDRLAHEMEALAAIRESLQSERRSLEAYHAELRRRVEELAQAMVGFMSVETGAGLAELIDAPAGEIAPLDEHPILDGSIPEETATDAAASGEHGQDGEDVPATPVAGIDEGVPGDFFAPASPDERLGAPLAGPATDPLDAAADDDGAFDAFIAADLGDDGSRDWLLGD
ncbi:MAG: hypothetical protein D6683_12700 [Actinomyces sp.]|nr:MAG: hypothetical protein D6683_12700 [Actinomyces sp.]